MKTKILLTLFLITSHVWAEFRAGAAKVDITPKQWPLQMIGSFHERLATKAHDPLHARAIVCDDGQTAMYRCHSYNIASRTNLEQRSALVPIVVPEIS